MSYGQPYDQGGPHGRMPHYQAEELRKRQHMPQYRQPPPPGYGGPDRARGQPPMRPLRPDDPQMQHPALRPLRQEQQQQYVAPSQHHNYAPQSRYQQPSGNFYDGSGYGEFEPEQTDTWPLPVRPSNEQQRDNSPSGKRGLPSQRPQGRDYAQPMQDASRERPPPQRQYYAPPPSQPYHGSGQWDGNGYSIPESGYPAGNSFAPQMSQQAYGRANQRAPLGPPPSARRGPPSYFPQNAPVHPIVEETDSMRGSVRTGPHSSYASSNAIPIGIPDYYLNHDAGSSAPSIPGMRDQDSAYESEYEEYPMGQLPATNRESTMDDGDDYSGERDHSPEPSAAVRRASWGQRSRPTLTTVKSGEKVPTGSTSNENGIASLPSQHQNPDVPRLAAGAQAGDRDTVWPTGEEKDLDASSSTSQRKPEYPGDDEQSVAGSERHQPERDTYWPGDEANALEAAGTSTARTPTHLRPTDSTESVARVPSGEIMAGGAANANLSSFESERERKGKKTQSKELLGYNLPRPQQARTSPRSPLAPVDPREQEIRRGLERGGALERSEEPDGFLQPPMAGMSSKTGKHRPPRLNVEAVKDAEARGSLTSLPDLIKRNMRLASNLDRGKTASRLGMEWFTSTSDSSNTRKSNGTISDMLSSFPVAPGLSTPTETTRSFTHFSKISNLRHSALPSDSDPGEKKGKRGRRCCGLPLWLFIVLCIVLFLLVAAAVVVPVMLLVVVPNEHNTESGSKCQAELSCQNGGTGVTGSDGNCRCVCVNGFTGDTCAVSSDAACTTTTVGGMTDATVGDAIPRLLQNAEADYGVPLDGSTILGLFSSQNLSCNSENALVTFNGQQQKRSAEKRQATPTMEVRQASSTTSGVAATSNGIVFETGTPSASSSAPSSTSSSGSSSNSTSSSSPSSASSEDFARVAVLYVFQSSGQLNTAVTAQSNLQDYFSSGTTSTGSAINPAKVALGNGYTCDLTAWTLSTANGTVIGRR